MRLIWVYFDEKAKPIPGDPAEKGVVGYNKIQQEEQHDFYKQWTAAVLTPKLGLDHPH